MAETPAQSPSFIHVHLLQNACQSEAARLFPFHRGRDKLIEGRGCTSALLGPVFPTPPVSPPYKGGWSHGEAEDASPSCPDTALLPFLEAWALGPLGPWTPEGHACGGREARLSSVPT